MNNSLNEHINKIKYLSGYCGKGRKLINEQTPISTQNQQVSNIDQQLDQLLDNPKLNYELNNAMLSIAKTLPADLTNIAKTTGNRDGQLDVTESLRVDEGLLMAAGTVLAVPKIVELMGKGLSKTGVKVNNQTIQKWGEKMSHFGHTIHNKYIGVIETILKPMTGYMNEQQRHALAGTILTMIVAGIGVASVVGAVQAVQAGHMALATAEGGLSAIKGVEIAEKVREFLPVALLDVN